MASKNGTEGRVYGGDCNLIHVADGKRVEVGEDVAAFVDRLMRRKAYSEGRRTYGQTFGGFAEEVQQLCPGCYMIVGFNMLVSLAEHNDQDLIELGRTMAAAFTKLADQVESGQGVHIEEITVEMDR